MTVVNEYAKSEARSNSTYRKIKFFIKNQVVKNMEQNPNRYGQGNLAKTSVETQYKDAKNIVAKEN